MASLQLCIEEVPALDYRALRARLFRPANAVFDPGIDLRRHRKLPWSTPTVVEVMPPAWRDDLEAFNEHLRALFCQEEPRRHVPAPLSAGFLGVQVKKLVAAHFGLSVAEMVGRSNHRHVSMPRQIGMYLCVKYCGLSRRRSAELFERNDHTTAVHAVRNVKKRMATDPSYAAKVAALVLECGFQQ